MPSPRRPQLDALLRQRWLVADLGLCAVVLLLTITQALGLGPFGGRITPTPGAAGTGVALALAMGLPLVLRRRFPVAVLAVVEASTALWIVATPIGVQAVGVLEAGILALLIAVYTVATRHRRPGSLWVSAVPLIVNAGAYFSLAAGGHPEAVHDALMVTVATAGVWAVGDNIGTRGAYIQSLIARARDLDRGRLVAEQRAVLGERTRIARELHDIVAHHVSAIAVQAGAAEEIAEHRPDIARAALGRIQTASRQALVEMRAIVGILREDGEGARLTPQPTLAEVERLAEQARATGLSVEVVVEGAHQLLPEPLELTAYRIVQEALTNTIKHGRAHHARIMISHEPNALDITVSDDGSRGSEAPRAGGRGIVGMHERVALFRGSLDVGYLPSGGFRVHSRLPLQSVDE